MVLPAGESNASVVDFGPVSGHRTDISDYPLTGSMKEDFFTWPAVDGDRNIHGPLSFCVPSAVSAMRRRPASLRCRPERGQPQRVLWLLV